MHYSFIIFSAWYHVCTVLYACVACGRVRVRVCVCVGTAGSKYIKTQKCVRENIARMSSKPLFGIQDDINNHRQQLLLIASGLQRNAIAIDKLKKETAQVIDWLCDN